MYNVQITNCNTITQNAERLNAERKNVFSLYYVLKTLSLSNIIIRMEGYVRKQGK